MKLYVDESELLALHNLLYERFDRLADDDREEATPSDNALKRVYDRLCGVIKSSLRHHTFVHDRKASLKSNFEKWLALEKAKIAQKAAAEAQEAKQPGKESDDFFVDADEASVPDYPRKGAFRRPRPGPGR